MPDSPLDLLTDGMAPAVYTHTLVSGARLHFRYGPADAADLLEFGAAVFLLSQGAGPVLQGLAQARRAQRDPVTEMERLVKRYGAAAMREPAMQVSALLAAGVQAFGAELDDGEVTWAAVRFTVYPDRVDRGASPPVLPVGSIPQGVRKPLAAAIDEKTEGEGVSATLRRFRAGAAADGAAERADGDAAGDAPGGGPGPLLPGQGAVPPREPAPAAAGG